MAKRTCMMNGNMRGAQHMPKAAGTHPPELQWGQTEWYEICWKNSHSHMKMNAVLELLSS